MSSDFQIGDISEVPKGAIYVAPIFVEAYLPNHCLCS